MKTRKIFWAAAGFILMGTGAVGAVVPILPCVVFLLGAAYCFARSSKRLEEWFHGTKLYKNNLESYVRGEGMTRKTKLVIMAGLTITMGVGFVLMDAVPVGRIILAVVWAFHLFYFGFRVKTVKL